MMQKTAMEEERPAVLYDTVPVPAAGAVWADERDEITFGEIDPEEKAEEKSHG